MNRCARRCASRYLYTKHVNIRVHTYVRARVTCQCTGELRVIVMSWNWNAASVYNLNTYIFVDDDLCLAFIYYVIIETPCSVVRVLFVPFPRSSHLFPFFFHPPLKDHHFRAASLCLLYHTSAASTVPIATPTVMPSTQTLFYTI